MVGWTAVYLDFESVFHWERLLAVWRACGKVEQSVCFQVVKMAERKESGLGIYSEKLLVALRGHWRESWMADSLVS